MKTSFILFLGVFAPILIGSVFLFDKSPSTVSSYVPSLEGSPVIPEDFIKKFQENSEFYSFDYIEEAKQTEMNPSTNNQPPTEQLTKDLDAYVANITADLGEGIPSTLDQLSACTSQETEFFGKYCVNNEGAFLIIVGVMLVIIFVAIWNGFDELPSELELTTCPNCKKKLQPGDTFCSKCGHKVGTKVSSQPLLDNKAPMKSKTTHLSVIEYASFGRRLVAQLIDTALNFLIVPIFINIYSYYKDNQTLGDKVMGIQVFSDDIKHPTPTGGQLTGRYLAKMISVLTLGIGYLMILFTEKKQGLHDKLADTVIRQVGVAHWGGAFVIIVIGAILRLVVELASSY